MSDIFLSKQDDFWKKKNEAANAQPEKIEVNQNTDTLSQKTQEYKQKKQQHYENWDRYGVDVPDEYYEVFNNIIGKAETPEAAQEEAYRLGSAVKYSQMMNIPLEEAYKNVDAFNEANFTDAQGQKGRFEALSDMLSLGSNNVKLGRLGQELMAAHRNNDTELANALMAEIDAINQQNVLMQDNAPRSWVMQALEAGAQSLPFTGVVAGAGIIGNFIAPAAGTGAAFAASSYLSAGQEYLDMIANGASPETARIVSNISGGIQGLIEADLGITQGIVKGTARVMGKEVAENAAKKGLEEIGRKVFKRFHFGAGKKLLVNYLENYGKNVLGEGTEEFLQEITSIVGQEVAASLDGYDISDDDFKSIVKQTTEAFRGGVLGALSMGFIPAGINGAADIKSFKTIKDTAEAYESGEMFNEAVKDSPVFEGMSETAKREVTQEIWERAQVRKEEEATAEAKRIQEVQDAAEGAEELKTDDEGEEVEATPVVRNEQGQLFTQDNVNTDDAGNTTGGIFVAGNRSEEKGNRYGYINWEYADGDQSKIVINDFKMAKGREGLRAEVYNDFAVQHPGVDIQWNTKGSEAQAVKEQLIKDNPSGAKNGLNYYADENAVADASTRAWVDKQIAEHITDYEIVDNKYRKTQLSKEKRAAAVALLEAAAKRQNMSLTEYVNKTFGNEIFGDTRELQQAALAQAKEDLEKGKKVTRKAGGVDVGVAQAEWKKFGQQVKAVIYAGENADFSTWTHELAHIFQNQLDGDLKTQAETAFNVIDGDWQNSMYTFKNGDVMPAAEAFAYGFQDWLKTGKAENEQMKNVFKKFAEFVARAFNSLRDFINLTPEITDVYNQLLAGDDSLLKAAEMAVEAEDRRYRAQMQQQAKDAEAKKQAEAEQQKKAEEAEREEASETTDFTEEENETTPEEAETKLDEVTDNGTEEKTNAIDNALENTNLTDEQKTQISDVLNDEATTVEEKAEAVTDAASSAYDEEDDTIPPNLFFQLAGEPSIKRIAEKEERERILADLDAAQLLDKKYKNMDAASKAARIRRATGWEKDASGNWKYELDDSINRIKTEIFKTYPELLRESATPTLLNLSDIYDAPELYKVFPYMKNVRVNFYSDPNAFRAVLTPQGIMVNTKYLKGFSGENGLKGVLAHEIQHVIQAMEFAESKGLQGQDLRQLYNDVMDAMKAAGERRYNYDTSSMQAGLDAYMNDAGEIEARNVARRILMNADQRRMNTLASTEDVKRLQFMNEADANEVETQEDYVRKQYEGTDQWLKAPNGKPTNLTEKQWLQTRTLNFKRWFGNWELSKKVFNVIPVTKAEFNTRDSGIAYAENNGIIGLMSNEETGGKGPINISKQSVGEMLNEAQRIKSPSNDVHYAVLKELRQIIKESELVDSHPDYKKDKDGKRTPQAGINENVNIDVMYGAINFDGKTYRVRTTIKRFIDPNAQTKAYAYSVEKIEVLVGTLSNDVNATAPRISTSITGDILLRGVRKVNQKDGSKGELVLNDFSKVLDENGEPMVMYHGTPYYGFNIFRSESYFTKNKDYAEVYKNKNPMNATQHGIYDVFLNVKKPFDTRNETDKKIFYDEFYQKWGNGSDLINGLPDWTDASDLIEFAKEKGYDGVYVDEGVTQGKDGLEKAGYSVIPAEPNQIKSATDNNGNFDAKNLNIYFQEVFHGSPHNFENFSTENIGTGEGAQAFGWGLYFTNQESIARFYADKLANEPARISLIAKNEYLKSRKKSLRDVENKEKYEARINKNINHFRKELKQAQKAGDESEIKFYEGLIDDSIKQLDENERLSLIESFKKDIATAEQEIAELKASMKNNRNLYTVEIPDEGYLQWDKTYSKEDIRNILTYAKNKFPEKNINVDYLMEDLKYPEKQTGEGIYKEISYILGSDKAASLFLKDLGYIGIDYPAHSLSGYTSQDERNYVIFDEANANIKKHLLYQNVYHGSGADFDKFDTENYGLSGEGSMTFGYGTYVTENEDIARDYAERQSYMNDTYKLKPEYKDWDSITSDIIALDKAVKNGEDFKQAKEQILKNLQNDLDKKKGSGYPQHVIEWAENDVNNFNSINSVEDINKIFESRGRHLYTIEIPDDGYLDRNYALNEKEYPRIVEELKKQYPELLQPDGKFPNEYYLLLRGMSGGSIYDELVELLKSPKKASQFLHSIGYAGIKYPAGTIHGNGNGAYNYVIFNDDDAKIVNHLFYQTEAELQDEALSFDNWQDFMEYCETFHADDAVTPIPFNSDAQWYQTFWETAHGIQTEAEKNEQAVTEKVKQEGMLPGAVDALFTTNLRSNPEMVDNFLKAVADIDSIDLDSEEWQQAADAETAQQRERIDQLKDFINITLSDYNWQTAIKRVQSGNEIAEGLRKRLIGEMADNYKVRDFRALYAEVMDDEQYAVDEKDSITSQLNEKLSKYQKRYYDILKPNEDIARVSPERRKRIAEAMQNRDIAAKIKNGTLKLDDEVEAYIKSLDNQINSLQKEYNELEKETKNDYQRIADAERRKLLKLHEDLLRASGKMKKRDAETDRKIKKGLKITEKYRRESQNMTANYDELFRKFTDLKNTIQITAEVQAALDRQDRVAGLKDELNAKQKEKNLTAEVKKMRIQLVKRTMRRVPFNRIDYENARTVIAIQRMLEPNLLGGVNRFIGIDSAYLRGVISQLVTDSDYKEKILNYLRKQDKSSQAFVDFLKKVEELKSIKDFDSWTAKERKYAIKHLPKENWVRDLNLQQLAKEREESIDLDIGMTEKQQPRIDSKTGDIMRDKEGNVITETAFVLDASEDLKKLVKDAVGADMFDNIVNKPFSEWTTEELEQLAQRIDEIYTEGRDLYAAKLEARRRENDRLRKFVEDAIKETGIVINDDDTPEEKEEKLKKIEKILNQNSNLAGTEAGKNSGIKAKFDRIIHGYQDANILRVARILDNQSEGINYKLLYRMEDDCFNNKTRSIMQRGETVKKVMADNKITEGSLAEPIAVPTLGTTFTVDELLYFLAADKDFEIDEKKVKPDASPLDMNDDYAATSRNAVMFGNMMSDSASQDLKESWLQLDKDMQDAIENDTLTQEQKEALAIGQLDKKPGTTKFINYCHNKWEAVLSVANDYLSTHPEYNALLEAIEADYAQQYERMNEISINEFNTPVHRVKAYVPLVRRESNGDINVNQVKEDLLGAYGADAGKQWVNKGMTQRRVNISPLNQKPVQTGLFRTWGDSIDRTEHFIAYAPYVRQLNAIYKSRDANYTRRFIEARYGKQMTEYIDSYINEVANPNANKIRERGAEFLHVLRGKTAPAYLGWKFSGIVKQGLTSPWPYMQFVNPAEYLAAATKCWTTGGKVYDAIKSKSAYMASRVMDPINELVDEMADNAKSKADRAWSKFAKTGMQGLEWIDWTCVAPGWLACYQKEYNRLQNMSEARYQEKINELTEKNMTAEIGTSEWMSREQIEAQAKQELMDDIESEAVRYADDCTRACQPSSRLTDLAPLFKNSSEAMKAFLQFQTSLNVIWQNIRYDIPYNIRQKEFKKIVGTVCGYIFAGIFMNSVMDGVRGDDDDDDTQALRNLIYYSTTQFTDAVPMIGSELTNVMDKVITGKRAYSQSGTDMTPSATKLLSALQKVTNGDFKKAASLTAEGIGLGLGAPVSGVKEINKLLGKPLSEGEINIKKGVGDVYGIAGDIIGE